MDLILVPQQKPNADRGMGLRLLRKGIDIAGVEEHASPDPLRRG